MDKVRCLQRVNKVVYIIVVNHLVNIDLFQQLQLVVNKKLKVVIMKVWTIIIKIIIRLMIMIMMIGSDDISSYKHSYT